MTYSFVLLTASLAMGQSPYSPAADNTAPMAGAPTQSYVVQSGPAQPQGLWSRIRNFFHPSAPATEYVATPAVRPAVGSSGTMTIEPGMEGAIQPVSAIVLRQEGGAGEPPLAVPATSAVPDNQKPELRKSYRNRVGYGEDFRWVTGQLSVAHTAAGSFWVVRYASVGQVDKYGGSMVLSPAVEMRNFREGDLVCIGGEVLDNQKAPGHLGGGLYRVNDISMITRSDPEQK